MKSLVTPIMLLVLVLTLAAAGCTGAPDLVRVGEEENGNTVTVASGGQVVITLPYDTITGSQWQTDLSDGLVITDDETLPGTQEWTVEPLSTGTFTFRASLVGAWDPVTDAEKEFVLTIRAV
ncbi:putative secreted protein [Methanofollis sp. W23]|uniref:protease inhibitor I42 family protein n=1 Tax=Methanofollis sp. W23 TaxID=2817849 RepID=UPI001AE264F3|nr:protease inhibitor I42 family protein [Methanofollis sp. W23]MBP2146095.1 putative secreted protein [Methanofollis sp. W23]